MIQNIEKISKYELLNLFRINLQRLPIDLTQVQAEKILLHMKKY